MKEKQERKRSKKWLWIPIGVLAASFIVCCVLVLTSKPSYSFDFLKYAHDSGSRLQVVELTKGHAVYMEKSNYRILRADPNLIDRVDKELSALGYSYSRSNQKTASWTYKGTLIYVYCPSPFSDAYIGVQTTEPATPVRRFQVWMENLLNPKNNQIFTSDHQAGPIPVPAKYKTSLPKSHRLGKG